MANWVYIIVLVGVGFYAISKYTSGGVCTSTAKLHGKVAIVTGANTGIGKETALDLVKRGCKVVLACRSLDRGSRAADDIIEEASVTSDKVKVMKLDLSSLQSVRDFAKVFKEEEKRLDILINNAAVVHQERHLSTDGFEETFAVSHLGHFLLTNLLVDLLKASAPSRVVTVSSAAYYFWSPGYINYDYITYDKDDFVPRTAYGHTKLANILFSRELAKRLEGTGVTTYSLHPGIIFTELNKKRWYYNVYYVLSVVTPFTKSVRQGAQTTICCAVDENLATHTGKYYSDCQETELAKFALNDSEAKLLWETSIRLVKLE